MTTRELQELAKKQIISELDDVGLQEWLTERIMDEIAYELHTEVYDELCDVVNGICSDLSKRVK